MSSWSPDTIKKLRKTCKLSKRELGLLVGADGRYIACVEKGIKEPCKTLKIALDHLEKEFKEDHRIECHFWDGC
jgi:predicted transcriptional regulator